MASRVTTHPDFLAPIFWPGVVSETQSRRARADREGTETSRCVNRLYNQRVESIFRSGLIGKCSSRSPVAPLAGPPKPKTGGGVSTRHGGSYGLSAAFALESPSSRMVRERYPPQPDRAPL
jgi:hypothetical protein